MPDAVPVADCDAVPLSADSPVARAAAGSGERQAEEQEASPSSRFAIDRSFFVSGSVHDSRPLLFVDNKKRAQPHSHISAEVVPLTGNIAFKLEKSCIADPDQLHHTKAVKAFANPENGKYLYNFWMFSASNSHSLHFSHGICKIEALHRPPKCGTLRPNLKATNARFNLSRRAEVEPFLA
ncbi:hypothetical protein OMP38_17360 [Cohnella ginsengisoli]|uniref:Uncharacterized protein n=1 Tax=Cohnella ginsengisoli TaxID=425004 RepID=A0A9X4KJ58_9BACL|nr:hypothetical protein [Cohnella ginsengisoli]MDG0792444.1 hypothetical protein [Cohnella ginsengisoli]